MNQCCGGSRGRVWNARPSEFAKSTFNPIRSIVDSIKLQPHPEKPMIALSIGDPTIFGNLVPHDATICAVQKSLLSLRCNGYAPTTGYEEARAAVAEYYTTPESPLSSNDVILTSGCSHALDLCIAAIGSRGQNILIPRPGFSIYKTLTSGYGTSTKSYNLLPDRAWEVDLNHLESIIDRNTAAIVINNPSDPCGSVYTKQHLLDILEVAERYCVPIIADEIYDYFVFKGEIYYPLATLSKNVPILSCSGLTKRCLVPGWRLEWITIHDRNHIFSEIRHALLSLTQRIIASNTLVQGALPEILRNTPKSFFDATISQVQIKTCLCWESNPDIFGGRPVRSPLSQPERLQLCAGLHPVKPSGAMYMMVGFEAERFPDFATEFEFVERLVSEQSVFCLPGKCFEYEDYLRIVLTVPRERLLVALDHIMEFCNDHYVEDKNAAKTIVDVGGEQVEIDHNRSAYRRPSTAVAKT